MESRIILGQIWKHDNGREYIIVGLANVANHNPKYKPCVVYESVKNGNLWTKDISNFLAKMTLKE